MKSGFEWKRYLQAPPEVVALARPVHGMYVSRETFQLPDLWALHFYEYHGYLEVDDYRFDLHPGAVTLVPPGAIVTFHYEGPSQHLYCHFRGRGPHTKPWPAPIFLPADNHLAILKQRLTEALGFNHQEPLRVNVRLWDVLLGLISTRALREKGASHKAIMETALEVAGLEMASAISVRELAGRCGISHNQFIRIVRQHTGQTPRDWLNKMRIDRASELLSYSDVPIKVVACEIGISDLQHFNKFIRQHFGCSPRVLRRNIRS